MPTTWLTVGEAARIAGVSSETIRLWTNRGRLKAERTPTGVRVIRRADLDRVLASRTCGVRPRLSDAPKS